jgi:hypothetical protein
LFQLNYRVYVEHSRNVDIDLAEIAHCFELPADYGFADTQLNYRIYVEHGRSINIDLGRAVHSFTLSDDQRLATVRFIDIYHLLFRERIQVRISNVFKHLKYPIDNHRAISQSCLPFSSRIVSEFRLIHFRPSSFMI